MSFLRGLGAASLLVLGGCVAASGDSSSGRASALADTISRASICGAGTPRANTLERFLAAERAAGAGEEQIAAARSSYVGVSEAQMVNQTVKPEPCTREERAELRRRMQRIRSGEFGR